MAYCIVTWRKQVLLTTLDERRRRKSNSLSTPTPVSLTHVSLLRACSGSRDCSVVLALCVQCYVVCVCQCEMRYSSAAFSLYLVCSSALTHLSLSKPISLSRLTIPSTSGLAAGMA